LEELREFWLARSSKSAKRWRSVSTHCRTALVPTQVQAKGVTDYHRPDAILEEKPELLQTIYPSLVQRVRFLDAELARGDTADVEPPQFSIEVFDNPSPLPLGQWLDVNNASKGSREEIEIDSVSCTQVTLPILMAPNQFIYCAFKDHVYKFTPLGLFSQDMLKSFKFGSSQ